MRIASLLSSLALAATPVAATASQNFNISSFTDFTTWTLFGDASVSNQSSGGSKYSNLILTNPGTGYQNGAAFAPAPLSLDFNSAFSFEYNFFIPDIDGLRGDGFAFVLAGSPGIGGDGSGLGYEGLGFDSIAFAVDTFDFGGDDPISPSIQILQQGSVSPLAFTETFLGDAIRDPSFQWHAVVTYSPSGNDDYSGIFAGTIQHPTLGEFSVSAEINFEDLGLAGVPVYYGFTAANGAAIDGHFITSAALVPEPGTWMMLLAGLGVVFMASRRTK